MKKNYYKWAHREKFSSTNNISITNGHIKCKKNIPSDSNTTQYNLISTQPKIATGSYFIFYLQAHITCYFYCQVDEKSVQFYFHFNKIHERYAQVTGLETIRGMHEKYGEPIFLFRISNFNSFWDIVYTKSGNYINVNNAVYPNRIPNRYTRLITSQIW